MIIISEFPVDFKICRYCPLCGYILGHRGSRPRRIRYYANDSEVIHVRRFHCNNCNRNHTELPEIFYPQKQYSRSVIDDILEGYVTETDDITSYGPSLQTIKRWRNTLCTHLDSN